MSSQHYVNQNDKSQIEMIEKAESGSVAAAPPPVSIERANYIRKQFDRRVLPIVCALYVLSYLDRGNIGNAKVAGAAKSLHLDSDQWAWVLNAFYICYVLFEWTNFLWKIFPAHVYVACLCVCWGTAAACSGAAQNMAELIVCRCFLGIFEAGFGAGAPYFLSLFYQRRELGFRVSLLLGMSPLANCFASALAYGITQIKGSLEPWRLLFIIEGVPTICAAPIVFFFLADSPEKAKFLKDDEQMEALDRLETVDRTEKSKVQWRQILSGLSDYQNYFHTCIHFCCNYSFAGLSNFLPTIVADMGYDSVTAQGLTAPPYFASFLCCVLVAFFSDKYGKRGYVVAFFSAMGGVGYLLLACIRDESKTGPRYAGIWLATCGVFPALAINITWLLNNQQGHSKRGAGLALLAIFGQCSSFISSVLFPKVDAPFYTQGVSVGCALTFAITIMALTLHFLLERENNKRDRLYGPAEATGQLDITNGGDNHPNFRYLT